jgi:phosphatidylinositol 4-phosphatase
MASLPFRDINVHASPSHYAFTSPSTPSAPTLVIERPSGDIRLNNGALLGSKRVSSIAGILGVVKLKLDKYIIVITKAQPMGRLRGHMLYKVVATEFLSLRERPVHDPDEDTYLSYLKNLLAKGPMYFSYSLDVTNSFQRQARHDLTQPLWKRADDRFFWNRFIQTDLIDFRLGGGSGSGIKGSQQPGVDPYILPVMFGMLRVTPAKVKSTSFTFALITRRSRFRGGTRYFSRGIDADGHVSNYNETEQIVILNDVTGAPTGYAGDQAAQNGKIGVGSTNETQIMSYVQTRGSVPVFWAEINDLHYTPKLQIRGVEIAVGAARKHFSEQIRIYGENYLVNLVNQRGREERVKKAYEQMVRILVSAPEESVESDRRTKEKIHDIEPSGSEKMDRLHYVYFDFHNETKGLKWHRAELLLDELIDGLRKGQYFKGVEMPGDNTGALDVRIEQSAVVRTNCMDCLDRTNVVQSMLGRWAITQQLQEAGILQSGERAGDDREFEVLFRNMWADNADVVSNSYSGTGALKTDFTRTGNRTRAGMAQDLNNSITRYVRNNFLDGPRQDGFDLFLGTYLPSTSGVGTSLTFADRRPLLVQSVPYVLAGSMFIVLVSLFTRRPPEFTVWPLRFFTLLCLLVAAWAFQFVVGNGMLYVNWPKLNTPAFAAEGYSDALSRAHKDKIVGQFITSPKAQDRRSRNLSATNMGFMEEGKKRIE